MTDEQLPGALTPTRSAALSRPDFPVARVARRLGLDPAGAEVALRDDDAMRAAIARSVEEFLAADDERRAGRAPASALALDPDFPTGVGMALVGAAVLWEARELVPRVALRVATDHYEDLTKAGVIDPTKVVRSALQNAASIAALLLTTEAMVSEVPEEKKEPAAPGGPGGMGGMY